MPISIIILSPAVLCSACSCICESRHFSKAVTLTLYPRRNLLPQSLAPHRSRLYSQQSLLYTIIIGSLLKNRGIPKSSKKHGTKPSRNTNTNLMFSVTAAVRTSQPNLVLVNQPQAQPFPIVQKTSGIIVKAITLKEYQSPMKPPSIMRLSQNGSLTSLPIGTVPYAVNPARVMHTANRPQLAVTPNKFPQKEDTRTGVLVFT